MTKYTCGAGTPEEAEANCTSFINGECTASWCEYRKKKQTNADRIRNMSDEELVVFLYNFSDKCSNSEYGNCAYCPRFIGNSCNIEAWLEQETEDDNDER